MKITFIGRDVAPSRAFSMVKERFSGDAVCAFLGDGKPIASGLDEIIGAVRTSDILISGMSSAPYLVEEELAAITAADFAHVPVILYADTHNSAGRPWFEGVRKCVSAIWVVSQKEARQAKEIFGLPEDRVILSGNPVVEKSFYPEISREESRRRIGVKEGEHLILSSGYKYPSITLPTLIAIVQAAVHLEAQGSQLKLCVVASIHPGDDAFRANTGFYNGIMDYFLYNEAVADLKNLRFRICCSRDIEEENLIPTEEILPGADLLISTLSTTDQEAAAQRIPVIEFFTPLAMSRMQKNFSTQKWETCEQGVAYEVFDDTRRLAQLVYQVLWNGVSDAMRHAQEEHYTKPKKKALDVMEETIRSFSKKL